MNICFICVWQFKEVVFIFIHFVVCVCVWGGF